MSRVRHRRLVISPGERYLWSVRHRHRTDPGQVASCQEILRFRREGRRGCLDVVFEVPRERHDGRFHHGSGGVGRTGRGSLNLHEPGVARALLDLGLADGWEPSQAGRVQVDGWRYLDRVVARG